MVSQSSSVGYTINGKTADLTVVQKTTIDTLHKEGKTQKVIAKEAGCSQRSVSKHINREAKGRKICGRKKRTSNRDNRTLERIVKQNPFKNVGEIHKEWTAAGVSASRTTTHRRMQDMGFSCRIPCVKPLLNNRQRQKRLAWAKGQTVQKNCTGAFTVLQTVQKKQQQFTYGQYIFTDCTEDNVQNTHTYTQYT